MPIHLQSQIKIFDQSEYHALNHRVLRNVFDVHNDFGRFLNEDLFKREIALRCTEAGILPVERELRIQLVHDSFQKDYLMDLLIAQGLMIEAKTCESIVPAHRSQALNYLLLTGMQHGSLVNLRNRRVEHEFISTQLTQESRGQFSVVDSRWNNSDHNAVWLKEKTTALLHDWGAFLEVGIYRQALCHFLGGLEVVYRPINLLSGERSLGTQNLHLLTPDTAFALSAITAKKDDYEFHLARFLGHTQLRQMHWINFNHRDIEFITLPNSL